MRLGLGGSQKETQCIAHGDLVKRKPRAGTEPNLPKPSNQDSPVNSLPMVSHYLNMTIMWTTIK